MTERKPIITVTAKDCDREVFRAGGKGGSNQNKVSSGVRWRHRASGAVGESRESRSQLENARIAWRRMGESATFKKWVQAEHYRLLGIERKVTEELMADRNLLVEVKQDGVWLQI